MRKFIMVFVLCLTALGIAACSTNGANGSEKKEAQQSAQKSNQKQAAKYAFPEGAAPTGSAKLIIVTKNGTSDHGAVPVINLEKNMTKEIITSHFLNFNKDARIVVYIDKVFRSTRKGGEMVQSPITLRPENALKAGVHTITAVQFEKNDPKGKIINYAEAKFEVKAVK